MGDDGGEQRSSVHVVVRERVRFAVETEVVWLFEFHQIDGVGSERNEDDLHDEYVERFPAEKEVEVSSQEHHQECLLRPVGKT